MSEPFRGGAIVPVGARNKTPGEEAASTLVTEGLQAKFVAIDLAGRISINAVAQSWPTSSAISTPCFRFSTKRHLRGSSMCRAASDRFRKTAIPTTHPRPPSFLDQRLQGRVNMLSVQLACEL